jgi:hypothetical protein
MRARPGMRAGGGVRQDRVSVVLIHCMAETPVMPINIPRIAHRTALSRQEIPWIDCHMFSVTRAILVSSVVAVSYILVNGMGMIWREVSPIFTTMIQSLSGKKSMLLFRKGYISTEYANAFIRRTSTRMLGCPLGNVRDSPQYRVEV